MVALQIMPPDDVVRRDGLAIMRHIASLCPFVLEETSVRLVHGVALCRGINLYERLSHGP